MSKYTHGHHETVLRSHRQRTAANSAAYLLPHLDQDDALLDIGAGFTRTRCSSTWRIRLRHCEK